MVRLLRMCVDYGENRVLLAKSCIPAGITPAVDIIRSYLEEHEKITAISFPSEVHIPPTNLAYYDEKCTFQQLSLYRSPDGLSIAYLLLRT